MDGNNLIGHIRNSMVVHSADGKRLGRVTEVYCRDDDVYVEVTPRVNLWKPWRLVSEVQRLYLPGTVVTHVAGNVVHIAMDATTARGCTSRPRWISPPIHHPHMPSLF